MVMGVSTASALKGSPRSPELGVGGHCHMKSMCILGGTQTSFSFDRLCCNNAKHVFSVPENSEGEVQESDLP